MRCRRLGAVAGALLSFLSPAYAAETRAGQILERFSNANQWRDHVMVVAHRSGGLQAGKTRYAENSLAALHAAIAAGAEMVEVDVRRSADGEFVVMHDSWLDRTTTCRGEVIERTLAELRTCRLVVEGTGTATQEPVSTLREFLEAARDRILVNIDNKLDVASLPGMIEVARSLGVADQTVVKENLWNKRRIDEVDKALGAAGRGFLFMPIIADDAVRDHVFVEEVSRTFAPSAIEMINWRNGAANLTETGGPLFSTRMRAAAVRGNWHIWADTYAIVNKPGGFLAGGRGDELAVSASLPAESWGFWAERGATIIQTDEPDAAIQWLNANGYRVPYGERPQEPASTASIN
ncbi:glycerophosphodiester phosphodiesterase family protein [Mesorhizobium sp. BE184]|uniref:glycerophosphodiester phosphodiesterase family protein n=1 Tax=Mesorhizobium sp. BE184 TaxID=2817714 RepID=UPI00285ED6F3|nr:glycerophosphodiester phosphodiesterase family protein [Mesorhizobium sp. BE184]MDR7031845.1 glycerophosphoryl diester phosphodiesterase [Mesorhizobium sp. BE184]